MIYNDEDNRFCDTGCLSARPRFQVLFQSAIAYTGQFLDGREKYNKKKFCEEMIVVFSYVNLTVGKFVQVMFSLSSFHFYHVALPNAVLS